MSKNEVTRMKSVRGKMAVLCPETDGLQAKHRIKRVLKGKTRQEREEELLDIVADEVTGSRMFVTKQLARLVSLVYDFDELSPVEVYHILLNEYFKKSR